MNIIKKLSYPKFFITAPPIKGKIAGKMFPAPAKPVYKALLLVPETSNNIPFKLIEYKENIMPPKINKYLS